jgi:hydroxymethylbilane synthase
LERLGLKTNSNVLHFEESEFFTELLSQETFLPAGGQGVIAVQIRSSDEHARLLLEPLNDFDTRLCLRAEREFLRLLHGDCNQPVSVLAIVSGTIMKLRAQVFDLEATTPREGSVEGHSEDAEGLAAELFRRIDAQ